ncbi:putative amidohydrolase [Brevibacterium sanguinis]|uniref:Amidohydrolase n=2 Tax=Brevibacterium TaxID=1696 RepID=A0ABX9GN39_9MICO|nr:MULTISPECIES: carbon-nitrogen hydrolase family protein [Brevibacterium]RBP63590.1 putative amidohydrolase [Brevibacterium sanguinis]RBP70249.1 putative amidohydrolase [Brevibacterium celere]
MRIAIAQMNSTPDAAENLRQVEAMTKEAAREGASLVIFPEATHVPFGTDLRRAAEELDGPWATALTEIALGSSVTVVAGMFRPGHGTKVVNTLIATGLDPNGDRVFAHYDKIHLYDAFGHRESSDVTAGEEVRTFGFGTLRVGLAVCYDIRFPALFTTQARAGADLIVVSASWGSGPGKAEQWKLLGRARALDSTTYIAACGQADPETTGVPAVAGSPTGIGHSFIAGPDGSVLNECGTGTELAYATIDPDLLSRTRSKLPVLDNSRLEGETRVSV